MNTVGWGIIGCGNVCEKKGGPPLYLTPRSRLVAVTRRNSRLGTEYVERHGTGEYEPTVEGLLTREDVDAVYVASPNSLHYEHACVALCRGKHVLVEKPMAMNSNQAREMISAARINGVSLQVAYYRRFYPAVGAVQELLTDGEIGKITTMYVNDVFPFSHRVDLAHALLGDFTQASVSIERLRAGSEEESGAVLRLKNLDGVTAVLNVSDRSRGIPEQIEIEGEDGRILVSNLRKGIVEITRANKTRVEELGSTPYTHSGVVVDFVSHLLDGTALGCAGSEGLKTSVILDLMTLLPYDGCWSNIDYQTVSTPITQAAQARWPDVYR